MALLTREQIMARQEIRTELLPVPEWGGDVLVRALMATEVTSLGVLMMEGGRGPVGVGDVGDADQVLVDIRAESIAHLFPQLVAWGVCDDDLNPVLTVADAEAMSAASYEAMQTIAMKVMQLSGMSDEEDEEGDGEDSDEGEPAPNA